MKNSRRFFVSALFVLVLLFSIASPSVAAKSRKRCPVRIPDSLLTLYLKSDLIVSGSIAGEKFLKKTNEYDYGYSFDAEKNLRVSRVLKGAGTDSAAFVVSKFQYTQPDNNSEEKDYYAMDSGDEALFFLVKNEDDNSYELADYVSGMKRLNASDLSVYVKRVEELKRITAAKKNQLEKLTEWLVRLVETPLTRGDGTLDLSNSFYALGNKLEEAGEAEANEEQTAKTKEPIVLDKGFRTSETPEIAELLTMSQKQRISTVLFNAISDDLLKIGNGKGDGDDNEIYPDYRLTSLVGYWDKTAVSMSSFALLQNSGGSNPRRIIYLMNIINDYLEDDDLREIAGEYESAQSEPDDAKVDYSEEVKSVPVEEIAENEPAADNEISSGSATLTVEKVEEIPAAEQTSKTDETVEKAAAKITNKEFKEKLLAKFSKQYGIAISQQAASN